MMTDEECIEVAEKVWGEWFPGITDIPTLGVHVRSYAGMGKTLEAMRAKGTWFCDIHRWSAYPDFTQTDDYWSVGFRGHSAFYVHDTDLPTAVHRAALAALRGQG